MFSKYTIHIQFLFHHHHHTILLPTLLYTHHLLIPNSKKSIIGQAFEDKIVEQTGKDLLRSNCLPVRQTTRQGRASVHSSVSSLFVVMCKFLYNMVVKSSLFSFSNIVQIYILLFYPLISHPIHSIQFVFLLSYEETSGHCQAIMKAFM